MSLRLDLPSCGYTRPNIREKWPRPSSRGPKTTIYKTNLWNPLQVTKNLEWRLENYRTGFIGEGECLLMLLPEITKKLAGFSRFELSAGCWAYADRSYVDLVT